MYSKLIGARHEKGLSQAEMAKLLNMSTNTYYLKENRKMFSTKSGKKIARDFTVDEARRILQILDKKYEDIFLN